MVLTELEATGVRIRTMANEQKDLLSDSHSSSDGHVESKQLLVLVDDGDVSEVVAVDIDIVAGGNSDRNLELSGL